MDGAMSEDIDYLRRVSARGAEAPLLGGREMLWWGALATIAYLAHYLAVRGIFGDGGIVFPLIWIAFGIGGGIGAALLSRARGEPAGAGSAGNQASRVAWMAAVAAILAYIVGAIARSGDGDYSAFDGSVPVVFAAYGAALAVSGWLTGTRAVKLATVAALVMVAVTAALHGEDRLWLAASIGALVCVFLPGLAVLRAEPRAR